MWCVIGFVASSWRFALFVLCFDGVLLLEGLLCVIFCIWWLICNIYLILFYVCVVITLVIYYDDVLALR